MKPAIGIHVCESCRASLARVEATRTRDQRWRKDCPACGSVTFSKRAPIGNAPLRIAYATQPGKRWGDARGEA